MDLIFTASSQKLVTFTAAGQIKQLCGTGRRPFTYLRNTSSNPNAVFTLYFGTPPVVNDAQVITDYAGIVLKPGEVREFDKVNSCCMMPIWAKLVSGVDPAGAGSGMTHQISVATASDLP